MIPEQHSDRLEAGALCFARLIGLLLGDLGQRPMHRAPSTAGGCNAEASRRYLTPNSLFVKIQGRATAKRPSGLARLASERAPPLRMSAERSRRMVVGLWRMGRDA